MFGGVSFIPLITHSSFGDFNLVGLSSVVDRTHSAATTIMAAGVGHFWKKRNDRARNEEVQTQAKPLI